MRRGVQGNGRHTGTIPRNINQTSDHSLDNVCESRDSQRDHHRNVPFSTWQHPQAWNLTHGQRASSTPARHAHTQDARQIGYQEGGSVRCRNSTSTYDMYIRELVHSTPQNQRRSEGFDRRQLLVDADSSKPMRRNMLPYPESDKSNISKMTIAGERKIPNARNTGRHLSSTPCRNAADDLTGAIFKSSGTDHRNELKLKVEESQRKLKEMQAHHAALQDMKHKAQEQLKLARVAQSRLVGRQMESSRNESECSDTLQLDIDNIRERIQNLNGLYESHNEMIDMIGDHDEELMTEHQALQDKLHELQSKKQQMESLVADLQSLNTEPSGIQTDEGSSSKEGSVDELSYPEQNVSHLQDTSQDSRCMPCPSRSASVVDDDMTNCACPAALKENIDVEIEKLTSQISQLTNEHPQSRLQSSSPENLDNMEQEEQAVNLSRQRQARGQGGTVLSSGPSTKRDNIAQANIVMMEGTISPRLDIKLAELQKAKERLKELKDVLNKVMDLKSHGETVPRELLRVLHTPELERSGESEGHPIDASLSQRDFDLSGATQHESLDYHQDSIHDLAYNLHLQPHNISEQNLRVKKAQMELGKLRRELPQGLQEKKTNAQVDVQTHQHQLFAKRKELEELMRKDQGQTSSLNQDVCSEISVAKSDVHGYSASNATWGGSIPDPVDELNGYDGDVPENAFSTRNEAILSAESTLIGGTGGGETDDVNSSGRGGGNSLSHVPSNRPQRSDTHNTWQKESSASATGLTRAKWTPSSQVAAPRTEPPRNMNSACNRGHESERTHHCPCQASWLHQQSLNPLDASNTAHQNAVPPAWLPPISCRAPPDVFYQQLLAATQVQQQQLLLTTMNQISYILWLQQRDLTSLRSTVTSLQEKAHHSEENTSPSTNATIHPEEPLLMPAHNSSLHPFNRFSMDHANTNASNHSHQPLKVSYSGGLFQQHETLPGSSGVTSAHSLPNLAPTSAPVSALSETPLLPGLQRAVYASSPTSRTAPVAPWLEVPEHLHGHEPNVTPAALNNQVPPGNRANNYWDNFRSYSRQNLLSAHRKSNEGTSHGASPLVGRSRNTLRTSTEVEIQTSSESDPLAGSFESNAQVGSSETNQPNPANFSLDASNSPIDFPAACLVPHAHNMSRKMKLNTEPQPQQAMTLSYDTTSELSGLPVLHSSAQSFSDEPNLSAKCRNTRTLLSETGDFLEGVSSVESENLTVSRMDRMTSAVYQEMKGLLSSNEERPDFLIQLFRDLQLVSTDHLRQHTLNAVHDVVSQYLNPTNVEGAHSVMACGSDMQWEMTVPALMLGILSYLNQHVNEICTPNLLKSVVVKILELLDISYGNSSCLDLGSSREQINSKLEVALSKFQGYRLEEVFQELSASVSRVLLRELHYAHLQSKIQPPLNHASNMVAETESEDDISLKTALSSELPSTTNQDKQDEGGHHSEVCDKENEETEKDDDGKEEENFVSVQLPVGEQDGTNEPSTDN
ncbi:pericentriolar material 1 protein isoform X2 [Anabrus simplex]|uniref:pericentriolar material 1 protein isoform X2 n=1 Tax=Anabrus simplex TaxID=316456 RepID=UPI0035A33DE9